MKRKGDTSEIASEPTQEAEQSPTDVDDSDEQPELKRHMATQRDGLTLSARLELIERLVELALRQVENVKAEAVGGLAYQGGEIDELKAAQEETALRINELESRLDRAAIHFE